MSKGVQDTMGLFEQWKELTDKERSQQDNDAFWKGYLEKEKIIMNSSWKTAKMLSRAQLQSLPENSEWTR